MIKVNGVQLPAPSKFEQELQDVDKKSGRNAAAVMMRNRVRAGVRILKLEWSVLSAEEESMILRAVSPEFVKVEYFDKEDCKYVTRTFYAGPKSSTALTFKNGKPIWQGLKFNLIER